MRRILAFSALLFILVFVNVSIFEKEKQLRNGKIVYLALRPADPRSLMQGDYMALAFAISDQIRDHLWELSSAEKKKEDPANSVNLKPSDGKVVVRLNEKNIARFERMYEGKPLQANELLLSFRVRQNQVKFGTNAYFFEEGQAEAFQKAKYGLFRVNDSGGVLLEFLCDEDLAKLTISRKNPSP